LFALCSQASGASSPTEKGSSPTNWRDSGLSTSRDRITSAMVREFQTHSDLMEMIGLVSKALKAATIVLALFFGTDPALAQTPPDKLKEAIDYMLEKAASLCGSMPASGSQQSYSVQGNIKAELPGILKKLTDMGISGVGNYSEEHYEGVLQSQLADVLKDEIHCKENTFNRLFQTFLAPTHQLSLSSARLIYDRLEPKERTEIKSVMFSVFFKNIGQSSARRIDANIYSLLRPTVMSAAEEDAYFVDLKKNQVPSHVILNVDIQPGQITYFIPGSGIVEGAWADFSNATKTNFALYLMSMLTYQSEELSDNEKIVTETCLIFERGDVNHWRYCASGHNTTYKID